MQTCDLIRGCLVLFRLLSCFAGLVDRLLGCLFGLFVSFAGLRARLFQGGGDVLFGLLVGILGGFAGLGSQLLGPLRYTLKKRLGRARALVRRHGFDDGLGRCGK